jgi:hypothetical protein
MPHFVKKSVLSVGRAARFVKNSSGIEVSVSNFWMLTVVTASPADGGQNTI